MTDSEHLAIQHVLEGYQAIVVHCDPTDDSIEKTWKDREQLYSRDPLEIARAYRRGMKGVFPTLTIFTYDWTASNAEEMRRTIAAYHAALQKHIRRTLTWWSAMPYGIGRLDHCKIILVGEQLCNRDVPFIQGPIGDWFAKTLNRTKLKGTYITNAVKGTERDSSILREEIDFLLTPYTKILLFGQTASRMFDAIQPSLHDEPAVVARVPHPQFMRRFHSNDLAHYRDLIMKALKEEA